MQNEKKDQKDTTYGEQLYNILFQIVGNKKNVSLIESLRGENAVLTYLEHHSADVHPGSWRKSCRLFPAVWQIF